MLPSSSAHYNRAGRSNRFVALCVFAGILSVCAGPLAAQVAATLPGPTTLPAARLVPPLPEHAPNNTGIPHVSVTPGLAGRIVKEVRIVGNATVPLSEIDRVIRTRSGDKFDPATADEDYHRIFELHKFSNVTVRAEPTNDGKVIVIFDLTEQKLIRGIQYHGNVHVNSTELADASDLRAGQAIDPFRISIAKTAIENLYRDKNYPFAHVDVPTGPLEQNGVLIFDVVEGPRVTIRKVAFRGNYSFSADKLKDQIHTSSWFPILRSGKYDPQQVNEDMAALRRYYESKGYFDARVGRKLIFSPDQSELEVDFLIAEGPRYRIQNIQFVGNSNLTVAQLQKGLKVHPGNYYDDDAIQQDVKQLVRDYSPLGFIYDPQSEDEAYLRIDTKPIFLARKGEIDLDYEIHEGTPFRIGRILVKGNTKSQEKLVLREFHDNFQPGMLFNSAAMQDATERLKASPYFSSVVVTPIGADPGVRDVLVEVTEAKTASFNFGAGVSSNGGIGGNITYEQKNFDIANFPTSFYDFFSERAFTGAGQDLVASYQPGTITSDASIRFSEPYLFDLPYSFSEEFYLRDVFRENYTDHRLGDSISFGKRFNDVWSARLRLRAEEVKINQIVDFRYEPPQILQHKGISDLTSAELRIRRDTTNPGVLPYRGSATNVAWEYYGALGGDYEFHKITISFDNYQSIGEDLLGRKTVFGLHTTTGFIPLGNSVFFERFYGGGLGSIRGFQYRYVSPYGGRGNDPVGGNFAITGSAELNFPIYGENLRGVTFMDAADVESDVRFGIIRTSIGAGIRLVLPFLGQAPIAIDFAVPLSMAPHDQRELISFSFGFAQ
ncbi:MAG TPA: POTRA domain-containing protein [Tepidisphaeraceae bacterium]|nr:POTRA domain-containing protein [Tepidisphaeraceae bacterium]